jgi:predicted site-specific integrase-resolvase
MKKQQRAILYVRVSAKEKKEKTHDLQNQLRELKTYGNKHKLKTVATFTDIKSGRHFKRSGFQQMLNELKSGRLKADLILFTEWDRYCIYFLPSAKMTKRLLPYKVKPIAIKQKELSDVINSYVAIAITI